MSNCITSSAVSQRNFSFFHFLGILVMALMWSGESWGQTTYYWPGSGTWDASNAWATTNGGTATTTWISGSIAQFDVSGSINGPSSSTNIYDIIVNQNVTVSGTSKTIGTPTGHKIATITVAAGILFDFGSQAISTASGTGFIKNGDGSLALNGSAYPGGFTLSTGTLIIKGVNSVGTGVFTINDGTTLAASATNDLSDKPSSIVIGGDFTLGSSTSPASGTANLTFNAATSLGSSISRTITLGGTGTYTLNGIISGSGSSLVLNATAAGTLVLGGANTYDGGTTITGGTLQLGASGVLADAAPITLNGGTLKTGATTGYSETVGTLTLSNSSTIALGTGVHSLTFAASNGISWSGTTLTVTGWTGTAGSSGTAGKIFVGTDATGLTTDQLAKINFYGYSTSGAQILGNGEIVPLTPPSTTYTWQGANGGDFQTATNWNPSRTTPATTDKLQFNDGTTKTITNVTTQTIGGLSVTNGTLVTLNSSGNTATLTINDGISGSDFNVASGSALNIAQITNANPFTIALSTGATGSISGSMDFSSTTASTPNQITAADASGLTFNSGALFTQNTNSTGNVFGSGTSNSVIFANGSTFIQYDGNNPFQKVQPASVVVFQTGSLFKIKAAITLSFSGRTYANLEFDASGSTFTPTGSSAVIIDNLTITNGTLNFNVTGTPGHSIKGNIYVASGATLNFAPSAVGTVNLNGTSQQTISGTGTIISGANSTLAINNSNGVVLDNNVNLSGSLTIASGTLSLNPAKQLTVSTTLTNNGTINLLSDGTTATILTPGSVTGSGTVSMNQYLGSARNWYISSPIDGATAQSGYTYYQYYEPGTTSVTAWTTPGSTLTAGRGYIAQLATGTSTFSVSGSAFTNSDKTVNLTRTTGAYAPGYNLVGNPFPSYLNINDLASNTDIVATYWIRTKNGSYGFDTYNIPGGMSANPSGMPVTAYIPPMQAFWLKVATGKTSASVVLENSKRSHQDVTGNSFRVPASKNTTQQVLRLQVSNGINSDQAVVYTNTNALNGYDQYDSPKYTNDNAAIPEIYTLATGSNEQLVLNGMNSLPFDTEIPLGFMTETAGTFNITASEITNLDPTVQVVLVDKKNISEPNRVMNAGDVYPFSSEAVNSSDRFSLIFKMKDMSTGMKNTELQQVAISKNAMNQITINYAGNLKPESYVTVYNAIGQKLVVKQLKSSMSVVSVPTNAVGVYLVTVKIGGEKITRKVILN